MEKAVVEAERSWKKLEEVDRSGQKWIEVDRSGQKWSRMKILDVTFQQEYLGVASLRRIAYQLRHVT